MPIEHRVEKEQRRIRAEVWGTFTMDDILSTIDSAVADPDFEIGFDVLSDHRGVERPLTPEQAQHTAAHLERLRPHLANARWAVVTTHPASYGMIRMLAVYAERVPMTIRAFQTMDEAEAWLDSPDRNPPG